jgi:hypothetical protein
LSPWTRARSLADRPWVVVVALALLAAVLTLPLWSNGFLTGHDRHFHLKWARWFTEQFRAGELYPRWLTGMNDGQGSPAFFFYGPIEYWITALLPPWSSQSFEDTARQLGLAASLAVFTSGAAFFAWIRRHVGNPAALAGAVAYQLLPYAVLVDVHARFAFAEMWSFTWMPLCLLFADRIVRGERHGATGFAVSVAALLMTHLPSTLIFAPVAALYVLVVCPAPRRWRAVAAATAGGALGAALAAVYLLPALTMQHLIAMPEMLWSDHFQWNDNFLFFGPRFEGREQDARFWTSLTRLALLTAGVGAAAAALAWRSESRKTLLFWCGVALLALFMTHPWSRPLWDLVHVVRGVQFPWRFLLAQTLAVAVLCAFAARALLAFPSRVRAAAAAALVVAIAVPWGAKARQLVGNARQPFHAPARYVVNSYEAQEYRPQEVSRGVWDGLQQPAHGSTAPAFALASDAEVEVLARASRAVRVRVSAARATDLVVRQFAFASWRATIDGAAAPIVATADGRIGVHVPDGLHEVALELTPPPPERIGGWISGAALAVLAAELVASRLARRRVSLPLG